MTKHAPGPWTTEEGYSYIAIRSDAGVWANVRIAGSITEQDRANARLIASAPDMLAALRSLLNEADSVTIANGGTPGITDRWAASKAARAAIAKATGA